MIIKEKKALQFTIKCLIKIGLKKNDAEHVSKLLVKADMSNHFSHGILRIIQYFHMTKKKIYSTIKKPKIINNGSYLAINGNRSFGQIAMKFACQNIKKTK